MSDNESGIPPKPKPVNAPKRPLTSFFLFLNDQRKKRNNDNSKNKISNSEFIKKVGADWRELNDTKKTKYIEQANQLNEKYRKKRAKYVKSSEYLQYKKAVANWNKQYKRYFKNFL